LALTKEVEILLQAILTQLMIIFTAEAAQDQELLVFQAAADSKQ
jgi:hypothetical protein